MYIRFVDSTCENCNQTLFLRDFFFISFNPAGAVLFNFLLNNNKKKLLNKFND